MVIFIAGLQYAGISDRYMLCTSYTEHQVHKEWYFFQRTLCLANYFGKPSGSLIFRIWRVSVGHQMKATQIINTLHHVMRYIFFLRKIKDKK